MFFKKKKIDHHAKKIDKLVTGLIIGGAVASMIGLSKTEKGKEITKKASENVSGVGSKVLKRGYAIFGKTLVKGIKLFSKK